MTVADFTKIAQEQGWDVYDSSNSDEIYLEITKDEIVGYPYTVYIRALRDKFCTFSVTQCLDRTYLQFDQSNRIMPIYRVGGFPLLRDLCDHSLRALRNLTDLRKAVVAFAATEGTEVPDLEIEKPKNIYYGM